MIDKPVPESPDKPFASVKWVILGFIIIIVLAMFSCNTNDQSTNKGNDINATSTNETVVVSSEAKNQTASTTLKEVTNLTHASSNKKVTSTPTSKDSALKQIPQIKDEIDQPKGPDPNICNIKELKLSSTQGFKVYSYQGDKYIMNAEDENGTAQIYIGADNSSELTCITCTEMPDGPKVNRFKMQPRWHPSGRWLVLAVEREEYSLPPILGLDRNYVEGQLQNGLWTNMWAVSPDGKNWHRLTDFKSGILGYPDGYTGPAITADGKKFVWSQIVDGNILAYWPFGRWELTQADFEEIDGKPTLVNVKDITPEGMHWNEPGTFTSDDESLLLSGSKEKDAQGMDQYVLNINTGELVDLTNSPTVWDEHGVFSPDGQKIIFISAHPYRDNPDTSKVLSIRTEFMLMNKDGTGLTQLTHFMEPGQPGYKNGEGMAATPEWSNDGRSASLRRLFFPNYEDWELVFEGPCGRQVP